MATERSHLHIVVDQDGGAILDVERGLISTLNATGASIWLALQEGRTFEDIVVTISRDTEETASIVESDVRTFIQHLNESSLLPSGPGDAYDE